MTTKLNDNASLRELMTALQGIQTDFQTSKNNIINAIGNTIDVNDKLSIIPSRITTVLTEKDNIISQLNTRYKYADGFTVARQNNGSQFTTIYKNNTKNYPEWWLLVEGLNFVPNIFVAECEYYDLSHTRTCKNITFACNNISIFSESKDFVINAIYENIDNYASWSANGKIYNVNVESSFINSNGVQLPVLPAINADIQYRWCAVKFI